MSGKFGDHLKDIRLARRLSQQELAQRIGVHATHISRYERNLALPSVDMVRKLAAVLEVSTDMLILGSPAGMRENTAGKLEQLFAAVEKLPAGDQNIIAELVSAFLLKAEMQQKLQLPGREQA